MQIYKYKESGIEWYGVVPIHWKHDKIFRICHKMGSGGTPKSTNEGYYDGEIPWIQSGDLNDSYVSVTEKRITQEALDSSSAKIFPSGTLLVAMYGATIGKLGIMEMDAATNQACCALQLSGKIESKYMYYLMLDIRDFLITQAYGGGQPNISQEVLKQRYLFYPSKIEQKAIADYLDLACARMDRIIAIKVAQLEQLAELRKSKIYQSVTRGINENIELKDSGVKCILKVPKDWQVKRFKRIGNIKYGLGQPPKELAGGLPLIRATNVFRGKIDTNNLMFVDPEDIPFDRDPVLKENDIIVVRSGAYTADSAIIPKQFDGAITGYDMVLRCNSNISPKFVAYALLSKYILNDQLQLSSLRAAQPHLNREQLGNSIIVFPSFVEQEKIAVHLDVVTIKIDLLKQKIQDQITNLKTYRKSLIHECVTGKKQVVESFDVN